MTTPNPRCALNRAARQSEGSGQNISQALPLQAFTAQNPLAAAVLGLGQMDFLMDSGFAERAALTLASQGHLIDRAPPPRFISYCLIVFRLTFRMQNWF
jgi:hypothetical protein